MKFGRHRALIILITAVVILVAAFMANEPQNRSRGGQRYIVENILNKAINEINPDAGPGKHYGDGYEYEILYGARDGVKVIDECMNRLNFYYDENDDSYVYFRKIERAGGGDGEKSTVYARITIKRDLRIYLMSFIRSKKSVVFLTILLLAGIALYFIFASYNHSIKAEIESQKYLSMQKLARGLAHEIRNPLNAIHLSLQLIGEGDNSKNDSELKECLNIIRDEIKRLDDTVEKFMRYSKDISLNRESVDINAISEKVARIAAPLFEQKKAALSFYPAEGEMRVFADGTLVHQTILNIVKNAAEAVSEGGKAAIKVSKAKDQNGALIEISNDGPRIAEKDLPKIFDFYFTTKVEGSGIGLALGKKIIEAHGGKLSVKSSETETVFYIEIPSGAK